MQTNLETIQEIVDYIDIHLEDPLDLDSLCQKAGYSKYHFSRMFSCISGFSIHQYIQRRRLTEAARALIFTDQSIMEIALLAGYETQQSFTIGFKSLFKCTPGDFRKKREFYPFQLKIEISETLNLKGDRIMDIRTAKKESFQIVGYCKNTKFGFFVIGKCWRNLHKKKALIPNRTDLDFLIGVNDYHAWDVTKDKQPAFDHLAGAEVAYLNSKETDSVTSKLPHGMVRKEFPASNYVVFSYRGKSEDSMESVSNYIYKTWFPQSTYQLNENAKYDFVKYGESVDKNGESLIEYWVPIV